MNIDVTLESLICLIRESQGFSEKDLVTEASLLEKDLGITGDDGCELLETIEKKFNISFTGSDGSLRDAFGLKEGQFLFHSEGMGLFMWLASLFRRDAENVKAITVGELYLAARYAQAR